MCRRRLHARERAMKGAGEIEPFGRGERMADLQRLAVRDEIEIDALVGMLDKLDPHPIGLEAPGAGAALAVDAADAKLAVGKLDRLIGVGGAVIGAERPEDERDIEPAEANDRPGALEKADEPGDALDHHHPGHEDDEALA